MDMKRKLEIMDYVKELNQKHVEQWKGENTMNINTAFVAEQKGRISEISDLLIVIQAGITNGNVAPSIAANSIGIAIDALQGVETAMNSVSNLMKDAE